MGLLDLVFSILLFGSVWAGVEKLQTAFIESTQKQFRQYEKEQWQWKK